jgi:serine/threonine protein kinase
MKQRVCILRKLGQGACGVVYKALDITTMQLVAVKAISVFDRSKRQQMVKELRSLFGIMNSSTSANHIVQLYDAFSDPEDGSAFLMMEYMDGGSLQDIVDSGGCSDECTLASIALQGLKGLEFLHKSRQLHRDIKPGNLLINRSGTVKVSDLGFLRSSFIEM